MKKGSRAVIFDMDGVLIDSEPMQLAAYEEVSHGKPAPDIFLEAAQCLGVPPEECVVIEDSQNGVDAAVQAGMYCIAVPNRFTSAQDFSRAHMRVPDLLTVFTLL